MRFFRRRVPGRSVEMASLQSSLLRRQTVSHENNPFAVARGLRKLKQQFSFDDMSDQRQANKNVMISALAALSILLMVAMLESTWYDGSCECWTGCGDIDLSNTKINMTVIRHNAADECLYAWTVRDIYMLPRHTELECSCDLRSDFFPGQLLKLCIMGVNLLLVWKIYDYYHFQVLRERERILATFQQQPHIRELQLDDFAPGTLTMWRVWRSTRFFWRCVVEVAFALVSPYPYLDRLHSPIFNDKVGLFMFLRLYLAVRMFRDFSHIYKKRRLILQETFFKKKHPHFNWLLSLQTSFFHDQVRFVIGLVTCSVLVFTYCIYVTERERQPLPFTLGNVFYFTCVTMTTVGYGDMSPQSDWGRAFALSAGVWGIVCAAILTGVMIDLLTLTSVEKYAVDWASRYGIETQARPIAASLIQYTWRYHRWRRNNKDLVTPSVSAEVASSYMVVAAHYISKLRKLRKRKYDYTEDDDNDRAVDELQAEVTTLRQRVEHLESELSRKMDAVLLAVGGGGSSSAQ